MHNGCCLSVSVMMDERTPPPSTHLLVTVETPGTGLNRLVSALRVSCLWVLFCVPYMYHQTVQFERRTLFKFRRFNEHLQYYNAVLEFGNLLNLNKEFLKIKTMYN
jgi:hypothetical protein